MEPTVEEEDARVKTIIESTRRNQAFFKLIATWRDTNQFSALKLSYS